MKISKDKLNKIKETLYRQGLSQDLTNEDDYFLRKKHISRFIKLIK